MTEKKKTPAKAPAKKAAPKKTAAKKAGAKKPAAKKTAAKKTGAKKSTAKKGSKKSRGMAIRRAKAEKRTEQEDGSVAPPTAHLVDAFAKFRTMKSRDRRSPSVTRLAPGASLPKPPAPPAKPAAPPASAPGTPPAAQTPAAPGTPPAARPPVAPGTPPAAQPPAPGTPPAAKPPAVPGTPPAAQPPAKPPAAQPPAAPAQPSAAAPAPPPAAPPKQPAKPEPKATYSLDTPARPQPKATYRLDTPAPPRGAPRGPARPGKPGKPAKPSDKPAAKPAEKPAAKPAEPAALKVLKVSTQVTVRELAEKMSLRPAELIKKLITQGVFATINQRLDSETAILVAQDYGFELDVVPLHMEEEITEKVAADKPEDLKSRSPVITVMGHVDHGKTKLLDAIRSTQVAEGEAGGITQHIGAYKVKTEKGDLVFLDTPGHEAFTAMRSRGAKVTDIVILVVSAADGVQPQTIEAIDHAKEANVPILVAVNKIDLPQADPGRIRQDLGKRGLVPEEWGGKTIYVDISAKKRMNIEKLLEMVLLQAEMLELKANPDRAAIGTVIEAKMDPKRGSVATVLIQRGSVKIGDPFVMGLAGGKIRALVNDHGDRLKEAGPATPVEILGIVGNVPQAGDTFNVVENERTAKEIITKRNRIHREEALAHKQHVSLLSLKSGKRKELPVILKADVQGSVEVLKDSLEKLSTKEIRVRVIHSGLGNANESDVLLAGASDAIVILFHVDTEARARETSEKEGVEIRRYDVIYDLTADVKAALEGLLEPEEVEVTAGRAVIKQEFKIRGGRIAGCEVVSGKAVRGGTGKIFRGEKLIAEAKIESLKRFKDDAKEVEKGLECGIVMTGNPPWKIDDQIEILVKEKRVRRLESAS